MKNKINIEIRRRLNESELHSNSWQYERHIKGKPFYEFTAETSPPLARIADGRAVACPDETGTLRYLYTSYEMDMGSTVDTRPNMHITLDELILTDDPALDGGFDYAIRTLGYIAGRLAAQLKSTTK